MENKRLTKDFFNRSTLRVARELLGKVLVRKIGKEKIRAVITETEAYCGPDDLASHASRGRTKRTEVMFGPAGHAYIYLIYGMYYCLNIVTETEDYPAAVLIRGATIMQKSKIKMAYSAEATISAAKAGQNDNSKFRNNLKPKPCTLNPSLNGPGKLCRFLKIDKRFNGEDLIRSRELWVEEGIKLKPCQIGRSKRTGVDYAGPYKHKLWRFYFIGNFVV